jgi:hypothetical protein
MPKLAQAHEVEIEGRELYNADVAFISLVDRPANRTPFRILKSAKAEQHNLGGSKMFDLSDGMRRIFKSTGTKAAIGAVLVAKSADVEACKTVIKAAGLSVDKPEARDDGTAFKQVDDLPAQTIMVKVSDDIALAVCDVAKEFNSYNGSDTIFRDVLAVEGFYPGMGMASDVLRHTIGNIMKSSIDPEQAAGMIDKACKDFSAYMVQMVKSIPITAFKFETAITSPASTVQTATQGKAAATTPAATMPAPAAAPAQVKKEAEATLEKAVTLDPDTGCPVGMSAADCKAYLKDKMAKAEAAETAVTQKTVAPSNAPAATATTAATFDVAAITNDILAKLKETLAPMAASIDAVQKAHTDGLAALEAKIAQVATLAKSASDAVSKTVGSVPPGDPTTTRKAEGSQSSNGVDHSPPLIDTAYRRP